MNIREVKINDKILKLEASALTVEKYAILTGQDIINDFIKQCGIEYKYNCLLEKYGISDLETGLIELDEKQQIECNSEITEILKYANTNFWRDVITAMIMAGEYPSERTPHAIWRDLPMFPQKNEIIMEAVDYLLNQIVSPDTKKKIKQTTKKT